MTFVVDGFALLSVAFPGDSYVVCMCLSKAYSVSSFRCFGARMEFVRAKVPIQGHLVSFRCHVLLALQPKTDKVHQIIARTALCVRKHGGQSEIVLRVKQGDNPTFGFLMPDHQLHPYFRFLIDHLQVLTSDSNGKSSEVENVPESGPASAGGALSLLGATYGSGEDEDIQDGTKLDSDESKSNVTVGDSFSGGLGYGKPLEVATLNAKQILAGRSSSSKDKAAVINKNRSSVTVKSEGEIENKRNGEVPVGKAKSGGVVGMKVEQCIVEPPSDVKRLIDKIVDFITKNGRSSKPFSLNRTKIMGDFPFLSHQAITILTIWPSSINLKSQS